MCLCCSLSFAARSTPGAACSLGSTPTPFLEMKQEAGRQEQAPLPAPQFSCFTHSRSNMCPDSWPRHLCSLTRVCPHPKGKVSEEFWW